MIDIGWRKKVFPPEVTEHILKKETLLDMQLMRLEDRCALLKRKFNFSVHPVTLSKYYKANKIGYLAVKTQSSACYHKPEITLKNRVKFLEKLEPLMTAEASLAFLDETTFVYTSMPKKLW